MSKVKEYWISKGLCKKSMYCLRLVNGTKGKILIQGEYKTKKEATKIGNSLLGKSF